MTSQRMEWLLLACALAACGKGPTPAATAPVAATTRVAGAPDAGAPDAGAPDVAVAAADAAADAPAADAPTAASKRGDNPDAVCRAIAARTQALVAKLPPAVREAAAPGFPGCVGDGPRANGTWAMALAAVDFAPDSEAKDAPAASEAAFRVALEWIAADGSEHAVDEETVAARAGLVVTDMSTVSGIFERLADFDGDGRPELVVALKAHRPEHLDRALAILRFAEGGVALWPGDTSFEWRITALTDLDHDGTLDLEHGSALAIHAGLDEDVIFPAVTHIGPHGRADTADPTATAYYRAQCPERVRASAIERGAPDLEHRALCALLWGEEAEPVAKALEAAWVPVCTKKNKATCAPSVSVGLPGSLPVQLH